MNEDEVVRKIIDDSNKAIPRPSFEQEQLVRIRSAFSHMGFEYHAKAAVFVWYPLSGAFARVSHATFADVVEGHNEQFVLNAFCVRRDDYDASAEQSQTFTLLMDVNVKNATTNIVKRISEALDEEMDRL